jgi:hypothetical protein
MVCFSCRMAASARPRHAEVCPSGRCARCGKPIRSEIFQLFCLDRHERIFHRAKNLGR